MIVPLDTILKQAINGHDAFYRVSDVGHARLLHFGLERVLTQPATEIIIVQ